jgi:hypothetical protein
LARTCGGKAESKVAELRGKNPPGFPVHAGGFFRESGDIILALTCK